MYPNHHLCLSTSSKVYCLCYPRLLVPGSLCVPWQNNRTLKMTTAEDELWELRQGGWGLERYVEEFLELSNRVSWHDASLGTCFHLGLNDKTIRCELPTGSYPLIELINLVLFLNGSDREVETVPKSCHPAPAETSSASPAHPMPRTSAYLSNCSPHLPDSEDSPSSPLVPSSSSSSPLVPSSSSSSPLVLPSSSSLVPPSSSPLVPSSSALTERPQVPLGLLVDYEGMVWSRAPEPAPRQRPPVPAPRQRPPVPAPRQRPPVPAPRLRPPVPAPRLRPPVPAPRQHPPVVAPRKLSPSFPLVLSSSALSERPRDAALPERPPVPVPSGSPEPLPVPSGSPEPLPVPSGSPEPLQVPSGSPEPLPFPSGSPEPLATTPPKSLHVMKSLPKKILGGGATRHGGRPSSPLHHGLLSPRIHPGHPSSLLRHGLPSPRIHHGHPSSRIHHGLPSSPIRHGLPSSPIRHGRPSSLIRHGLPSPRIHHGHPSSPIRHGRPSSPLRRGRPSFPLRRGSWNGRRPGGLLSCPVSVSREASRAPTPPPLSMLYGAGRAYWEGGVMSDFVSLCLVFPYPCVMCPYLVLPVSCHH